MLEVVRMDFWMEIMPAKVDCLLQQSVMLGGWGQLLFLILPLVSHHIFLIDDEQSKKTVRWPENWLNCWVPRVVTSRGKFLMV